MSEENLLYFEDFQPGNSYALGRADFSTRAIVGFAQQFDFQPMHLDEQAGKASMLGGLGASGWHTGGEMLRLLHEAVVSRSASLGGTGIESLVWKRAVLAGDTLNGKAVVAQCRDSEITPSNGVVDLDVELVNQRNELVISARLPLVVERRSGAASR